MTKVAGVDVLLKIRDAAGVLVTVGGQTGSSLSRSASAISTSDKTTGGWSSSIVGLKSWTLDAEGFVSLGNDGQGLLEDAFENRSTVVAVIRLGADADVDGVVYQGEAVITSLENEFSQEDAVTFSVSLEGAGALTRVVGAVTP